jgi:hypothetical protein
MKRIIAILSVVMLVACLGLVLTGCGAKDEEVLTTLTTTTTTTTSPATTDMINDGMVTDESTPGDNGVIGDIVTDVSEGLSDMVTDVSDDMRNMRNAMR